MRVARTTYLIDLPERLQELLTALRQLPLYIPPQILPRFRGRFSRWRTLEETQSPRTSEPIRIDAPPSHILITLILVVIIFTVYVRTCSSRRYFWLRSAICGVRRRRRRVEVGEGGKGLFGGVVVEVGTEDFVDAEGDWVARERGW